MAFLGLRTTRAPLAGPIYPWCKRVCTQTLSHNLNTSGVAALIRSKSRIACAECSTLSASRSFSAKSSHLCSTSAAVRSYCQKAEDSASKLTYIEKIRKFWNGPNFKYWFIGVSAFSVWLFYYGLNSYKSTRIDIAHSLAVPNHALSERITETSDIFNQIKQTKRYGGKVRMLSLNGPSGAGKSLLANFVADLLIKEVDWNPVGLPKSHVKMFLNGDTLESFYFSLQAFAGSLKLRPAEIKSRITEMNVSETPIVRCEILLDLIREKLAKHPDWVIVIDNVRQGALEDVMNIINNDFVDIEKAKLWSRGTVIITKDGFASSETTDITSVNIEARMPAEDAIRLLQNITNIQEESFQSSAAVQLLLSKIHYHPMSIVSAGILLKHRLTQKELKTIDGEIIDLVKEITDNSIKVARSSFVGANTGVAESLIIAETLIAMEAKLLLNTDPHIPHAMDLLSTCAPRIPVPSSFVKRYLQHPSLNLPPIIAQQLPSDNLQQMFSGTATADANSAADETLEPKGRAWSNKNITEYITRAEVWITELYDALKQVYNFYFNKEIADVAVDDGLGMLRDCELICSWKMQPGDVDSFTMHPLMYAVLRQHFLASTVSKMESKFIEEDEARFNQQSWYKKMSKYDAKISLQRYRNEQEKMVVDSSHASHLLAGYNNDVINVSGVLQEINPNHNETELGLLSDADKLKYVQSHLDRVIHTLSEDSRIAKQNVGGKTGRKYLSIHGEYLRNSHPLHMTGLPAKVTGLLMLATSACLVNNDTDAAIAHVDAALQLLRKSEPPNDLEVAGVVSRLAALYNTKEDHEKAKECLLQAIDIYESQRRKDGEYKKPLELGKALGALGVLYGTQGDRIKSKELVERSLMLQQAGAPDLTDEGLSKHFGAEFARALTDLGHSYVSLGMPLYGRKILNLALMAHKNLHGDKHPEVVRTLTVMSIAHLMQGHNEESKKMRREAAKLQSQINALPNY